MEVRPSKIRKIERSANKDDSPIVDQCPQDVHEPQSLAQPLPEVYPGADTLHGNSKL